GDGEKEFESRAGRQDTFDQGPRLARRWRPDLRLRDLAQAEYFVHEQTEHALGRLEDQDVGSVRNERRDHRQHPAVPLEQAGDALPLTGKWLDLSRLSHSQDPWRGHHEYGIRGAKENHVLHGLCRSLRSISCSSSRGLKPSSAASTRASSQRAIDE